MSFGWSVSQVHTQPMGCIYPWPTLSSGDLRCHGPPRPLRMTTALQKKLYSRGPGSLPWDKGGLGGGLC